MSDLDEPLAARAREVFRAAAPVLTGPQDWVEGVARRATRRRSRAAAAGASTVLCLGLVVALTSLTGPSQRPRQVDPQLAPTASITPAPSSGPAKPTGRPVDTGLPPTEPASSAAAPTRTSSSADAGTGGASTSVPAPTASGSRTPPGTPTVSPTSAAPAPSPRCSAAHQVAPGVLVYQGTVTVTNQSPVALTGWTVSFQLPLGGVMTSVPGFGFGQLGTSITVWSPSGLTLPANGQVSFTFNATGLVPASGSSFSLNGIACQG